MLQYLNGIGATRRRGVKFKKNVHKMPLPIAAKQIKEAKRISPLMAAKMQKAFVQQKIRDAHAKSQNPFMLAKEPSLVTDLQEFEDAYFMEGENEVNAPEFEGDDMGVIYPGVAINGRGRERRERKRAQKEKKRADKNERKNKRTESKANAREAKAEGKRLRGEGKRLKGEGGGSGDFKEYFSQGLDTVKSVFGKGGGSSEPSEDLPSSSSSSGGGFFAENKTLLLVGGAGLAAALILPKVLKK